MVIRLTRHALALAALCGALCAARAQADKSIDDYTRELANLASRVDQLRKSPIQRSPLGGSASAEQRFADGELFFRLQDYPRAAIIFTGIVDNYPQHRVYPDAVFLLGESLFKAGDYLGARARYREIIAHADQPGYSAHVAPTLGRLIEIAVHTRDFTGVEDYFTRLSKLPPAEVEAATNYFRAKYLYATALRDAEAPTGEVDGNKVDKPSLEQARLSFEAVAARSPYYAQARYFIGVVYVLRGELDAAADAFARVTAIKAENEDQRRIVDLAALAIGRLRYQQDQLLRAIEAYQKVSSSSPVFDTALYEIAWVYIRMGDSKRAEHALEVLALAVPDSQHIPDGQLLRGNLLLRDGDFNGANAVFAALSSQFGAVRDELDGVLAQHEDAPAYFAQLVRDNLDVFDARAFLPPSALRWATLEGDMQRAMDALSDLSEARRMVGEIESIVARFQGALSSPVPTAIFRDLRGDREESKSLHDKLARVRKGLIAIDDENAKRYSSAELTQVRTRRHEIETALAENLAAGDDLHKRVQAGLKHYDEVAKRMKELEVELMGMEARIAATDHFLTTTAKGRDPQTIEAVRNELSQQKAAVVEYRKRIKEYGLQVETGRMQVGVADSDSQREDSLRKEYAGLVERERQLLSTLGAKTDPRVDAAFRKIASVEAGLDSHDQDVDAVAAQRATEMRKALDDESAKLVGYRSQVATLETQSEEVVGGVALDNFRHVQKRFYDLVLRADVGTIDVAWAVREDHRTRGETLTRERARALQSLDDEYRDIMDQQESR